MYLVDTNVCILAIAGREPDASFLRRAIEDNAVRLSAVTVAEFLARGSHKERIAFDRLAAAFPILPIDEAVARLAAGYRKRSLRSARVTLLDCLLTAQARVHALTLVTNNRRDFPARDIRVIAPSQQQ